MKEILEKLHAFLSLPENRREGYVLGNVFKFGFGSRAIFDFSDYNNDLGEGDKFEVLIDWENKPFAIKWSKIYSPNRNVEFKLPDVYFTEHIELVVRGNSIVIAKHASKL